MPDRADLISFHKVCLMVSTKSHDKYQNRRDENQKYFQGEDAPTGASRGDFKKGGRGCASQGHHVTPNYGEVGATLPKGHHFLIKRCWTPDPRASCHTWVRLIPSMSPSCEAACVLCTTIWGCSASHLSDDLGHQLQGVLGITIQ